MVYTKVTKLTTNNGVVTKIRRKNKKTYKYYIYYWFIFHHLQISQNCYLFQLSTLGVGEASGGIADVVLPVMASWSVPADQYGNVPGGALEPDDQLHTGHCPALCNIQISHSKSSSHQLYNHESRCITGHGQIMHNWSLNENCYTYPTHIFKVH